MKLKTVKAADLKPHPSNPNLHPAEQLQELQSSLDQFDQVKNIVVWKNKVIAGCGLLAAAKAQGRVEIEASDVSDWDEEKAIKLMISDNRLAELAIMDDNLLTGLIKEFDEPLDIPGVNEEFLELLSSIEFEDCDTEIAHRDLGNKRLQIKPVIYLDEIAIFEEAILSTEEINRGNALIKICKFWIDNHEAKKR